jgi:hypothetical protein
MNQCVLVYLGVLYHCALVSHPYLISTRMQINKCW